MKFRFILPVMAIFFIFFGCPKKEIPYFSHVYGWLRQNALDTIGVNNVILQIWDVNPDNPNYFRRRDDTTMTNGARNGFFEMDSVCYGTSGYLSSDLVRIVCDSTQNPGQKTLTWFPPIMGGVDTIYLNLVGSTQ
jgi:hypothetical protein